MLENPTKCTIYDCEFDQFYKGVIISNIIYVIENGERYVPAKEIICEYVDYGLVQYYTGCYGEENDSSKWGYFDHESGIIQIPAVYDYAAPFYGDRARVEKNGKIGYIDPYGKLVIDIVWDEINRGRNHSSNESDPWVVRKDDKWGYINRDGDVIIPLNFDYASIFCEDRARIKKDNKWGYINKNGIMIIEPIFDEVHSFKCIGENGTNQSFAARVKQNGKYGFINEDGKYIIEPIFEDAFEFWDIGFAGVKKRGKWGIIDRLGNLVVPCKLEDIGEYYGIIGSYDAMRRWGSEIDGFSQQTFGNENLKDVYFTIKLNNKWGIMDLDFNVIMPTLNHRFVEFRDKKIYLKGGNVTSVRKISKKND
jgi:hypothetical protein